MNFNANTQTLIHHFLETSAQSFPDKIALIHDDVRATYSQINNSANHLADWLTHNKITKGDRVVLILENSIEYVISYYGILKSGAVVAALSTDLKPDSLKHLLAELKPKLIISSFRFEQLLQAADLNNYNIQVLVLKNPKLNWASVSIPVIPWGDLIQDNEFANLDTPIDDGDPAGIVYTSGSTGKPKGVMLSHRNIVSNTHSIRQYLGVNNNDIQMVVLPFFYVMGKSLLNTHVAAGGTVVINNKFAFPAAVIKQMADENVTAFSGVPSTYAYLLHRSPLAKYRDQLPSLRYCSQAGGHMSKHVKQELRRVIPEHTQIYIMYGATEASARLTYLEPDQYPEKMESIGKPIPGVTLRILGTDGKDVPGGRTGELVASGPNIMRGYWNDDHATKEVLDQNGYHTGDMGYQDSEGYFYITGRNDNLVKVGGHRINPQEVEDVLMDTQMVIESIVLGLPDQLLGNRLVALVTPKSDDCNENNILGRCLERLPKYKLPSEVIIVKSLPKSLSGKIDRTKCLELISKP